MVWHMPQLHPWHALWLLMLWLHTWFHLAAGLAGMLLLLQEMQTRPRGSEGGLSQRKPKQEAQFVSTALRSERHNWLGLTDSGFWANHVTAADSQAL